MKKKLRLFIKNIYRRRAWRRLVSISSCIVVFVTTYALLLPAITMGKMADCGLEEHQHSDECYREYLICGLVFLVYFFWSPLVTFFTTKEKSSADMERTAISSRSTSHPIRKPAKLRILVPELWKRATECRGSPDRM